jgi:hypothetical protein
MGWFRTVAESASLGEASHQQNLGRGQVVIYPTLEFWAGVAEVSWRPFAGGVPVERDKQVRDELSHVYPFLVSIPHVRSTPAVSTQQRPERGARVEAERFADLPRGLSVRPSAYPSNGVARCLGFYAYYGIVKAPGPL